MSNQPDQKFIIRSDRAGVFFAEIIKRDGDTLELKDARKIYYWAGANTVQQIATDGINSSSRVTVSVPSMTVFGAIEIIPCTEKSANCINGLPEWKQ